MGVQSCSGMASMRLRRLALWRMVMEKRTSIRRQAATMAWVVEAAVGPHRELSPGPGVAHPPHRLPQEVGGAPSGVGPALAQPGHQHVAGASGHGQQRVIAPLARVAVVARPLLGQTVCLADRRIQVDGEWRVAGSGPTDQARASSSRLTRSNWRTWPHRKLRRKVPRVDGALTMQPRVWAVSPVRNTSASSMQSPPASADATRVSILSPGFARPGALPRSR